MLDTIISAYRCDLVCSLDKLDASLLKKLVDAAYNAIQSGNKIYLCGNGGSAANAIHICNDLVYGANPKHGVNAEALTANSAVLTCLGNDIGYDNIFSHQIKAKACAGDLLIVFSGSGNSANIIEALKQAAEQKVLTCAVLGFDGGKAKTLADIVLHIDINDMQIAEDMQVVIGHILMKALNNLLSK